MELKFVSILALILLSIGIFWNLQQSKSGQQDSFLQQSSAPYSSDELNTLKGYYLSNIDYQGKGSVLASPSQSNPNYFYHWVRDAAISMKVLLDTYGEEVYPHVYNYIDMEITHQHDSDPNGINILGEPKFYVEGNCYDKPWGRPQDDSPALRAITMIDFANRIIDSPGGLDYIRQKLYADSLSDPLAIKTDLEYVSHNWQENSFDLWEESNGAHFFTRMVQRRALLNGADFANKMNDTGAANFYNQQAKAIEGVIDKFWDSNNNVIMVSMPGYSGPFKFHYLDSAQILGSLYGDNGDGFYTPGSDRVLATAQAMIDALTGVYPINSQDDSKQIPGFLIGRYPNDTYDGYKTGSIGNPWILTTNAFGELHYKAAQEIKKLGKKTVNEVNIKFFQRILGEENISLGQVLNSEDVFDKLMSTGDDFLLRAKYHIQGDNLHMAEEINLDDGYEQGAVDLTWSYGTAFSAMNSRK